MKIFAAIKTVLDKFGEWWSLLVFVLILLPTLESVILRSLLNEPTIWSQELTVLTFGIYFMIGGAYCESRKGHISMDIFSSKAERYAKIFLEILAFLCASLVLGVLGYFGILSTMDTMRTLEKTNSVWGPVVWPSRLAVAFGVIMLYLRTIISTVEKIEIVVRQMKGQGK